jgi:hypothetical protein
MSWPLRLLSKTTKTRAQRRDERDSLAKRLKNENNHKLVVVQQLQEVQAIISWRERKVTIVFRRYRRVF